MDIMRAIHPISYGFMATIVQVLIEEKKERIEPGNYTSTKVLEFITMKLVHTRAIILDHT